MDTNGHESRLRGDEVFPDSPFAAFCHPFHILLVFFSTLVPLAPALHAAPAKSGVGLQALSLPSGPGSIEGLGDSFQPALNTGTARHTLPIKTQPGPAGHAPQLALQYDGGAGNSPLGIGWRLTLPFVQRQCDQGIPRYVDSNNGLDDDADGTVDEPDELDTFINEFKEELVPVTNNFFFCKNEGPFIRYQRVNTHWEATRPDGTRLVFGLTDAARVRDAATGRVFQWLLELETDLHSNTIRYAYSSFPSPANTSQSYLAKISFAAGPGPWTHFHFLQFQYEDRPDWFEDGRPGFLVRTGKRLIGIHVATQTASLPGHLPGDRNGDAQPDFLIRSYELAYAPGDPHWSLLRSVRLVGADDQSSLPPVTFEYTSCALPGRLSAQDRVLGGINEPAAGPDNPLVGLVDLNGDALPDLLKTDRFGGRHTAFLNRGAVTSNATASILWSPPIEMQSADGLAWTVQLEDNQRVAHLADMDGDGLADLVFRSVLGDFYFFPNTGQLQWSGRTPVSVLDFGPPSPFAHPDTRSADLDFDKRLDIIQSVQTGSGADYRIWFNRGGQQFSRPVTVPQTSGFMFSLPGVATADFNGDRVPDILRLQPVAVTYAAGLGHGAFAPPVSVPIPDWTLDSTQIARAAWEDLNGDGLADLAVPRAAPGECWLWINLGNHTLAPRIVIGDLPPALGLNRTVLWADLNGNGTTDLLLADSTSLPRIAAIDLGALANCAPKPHTLLAIHNGLGQTISLTHTTSVAFALADAGAGQPWPDPLPFPLTVVSRVAVSDSLGNHYTTDYRYHDGYYDGDQKEFRGFARVDHIDHGDPTAPTRVSRSHFDTGRVHDAMKGRQLRLTLEQEDGQRFWDELTQWADPPTWIGTGLHGHSIRFAHPVARQRVITELGHDTPRTLEWEFEFDHFGNPTLQAEFGVVLDGDPSALNDERLLRTEYALNLDRWILRHPSRTRLMDEHGAVLAQSELFYDDPSFSGQNAGQILQGNLTLQRDFIDPANPAAHVPSARIHYNPHGLPVRWLDPLAQISGNLPDPATGHFREVTYDAAFHTHPVSESIHVGSGHPPLVAQADYDAGFGVVTGSTDFNGHPTAYTHDPHGRLTAVLRPGDDLAYPSLEYDYALAQPATPSGLVNYIETRTLDRPPGSEPSHRDHYFVARQFLDGLGRPLQTKQEATPDLQSGQPRVSVLAATRFNARREVASVLNPFLSTLPASSLDDLLQFEDITAPGWTGRFPVNDSLAPLGLANAHQSRRHYDALLRPVRIVNPDGSERRTEHVPLATRHFDENDTDPASPHNNTPHIRHQDGLGRLIQVDEIVRIEDDGQPAATPRVWSTRYEYNLIGNLTRHTDSQNNSRLMTFDGLQRLTALNDPDRGRVLFTYDAASNLRERVDAKGQVTRHTYDGANRLLTEDYLDALAPYSRHHDFNPALPLSVSNRADVCFFYDQPQSGAAPGANPFPARNTRGVLASVWDLSGEEHTSYDHRGRVESVLKILEDPLQNHPVPYTTSFAYDAMDRLTSLIYPDNDRVEYHYNARNLLREIRGESSGPLLADLDYLPSGQTSRARFGNQASASFLYDTRLRLAASKTILPAQPPARPDDTEILHHQFTLDPASNLLSIQDQRPGALLPSGNPRRNSQSFQYDNLDRLTRAAYAFHAPGDTPAQSGSIQFRHDRIGNLLEQTSSILHLDQGRSVVDLGTLDYGAGNTHHRAGRAAADPPGPHALTSVMHPEFGAATLDYDANGNTTQSDGLQCAWDFKDRLVTAETPFMRADYTHDYTGRRVLKTVTPTPPGSPSRHTLYVGRHFEIREGGQPVKHVWNGSTRVARVTGSLSLRPKTQHLRILPGWNLLAPGVHLSQAGLQLRQPTLLGPSPVEELFRWDPASQSHTQVQDAETLPAGTVLWLRSTRADTLLLTGTPAPPTDRVLEPGTGAYLEVGLSALRLDSSLPADVHVWLYDANAQRWAARLPEPRGGVLAPPEWLPPGQAMFLKSTSPASLLAPDSALDIRYYHQDHLGSSAVIIDAGGNVVEETAYYPYGHPRNQFRPLDLPSDYGFAGKERDGESSLHHFEARNLLDRYARFASVDPLAERLPESWLANPQRHNLYAYALNNPVAFDDADGREARVILLDNDNVLIQLHIKYYGRYATAENIARANEGIEEAWSGKFGKYTVRTQVVGSDPSLKPSNVVLGQFPRSVVYPSYDAGFWNPNEGDLGPLAAHEAGHLLGLGDRYTDQIENGQVVGATSHPGWEGNLLAELSGDVEEKNIDEIVTRSGAFSTGQFASGLQYHDFRAATLLNQNLQRKLGEARAQLNKAKAIIRHTESTLTPQGRREQELLDVW